MLDVSHSCSRSFIFFSFYNKIRQLWITVHSSNLPQLKGSEATVKFIIAFDYLFDILNSCNPCTKGFKAGLHKSKKSSWKPLLDEASKYIIGLENTLGKPMYTTCCTV